jgi:glyceraldehyde 3-phosphate dehydrogenase
MAVRVAINGFGRIGRLVLRAIAESGRSDIQVVAINDLGPIETNAHLLRFDSVHGRFPHEVVVDGDTIDAGNGQKFKVTAVRSPAELPHRELGVVIVLECTGIFSSREKAAAEGPLKDYVAITTQPNVSSDFNHDPHSATFHLDQTRVIDGEFVRVVAWYDNEWGFSNRMGDATVALAATL